MAEGAWVPLFDSIWDSPKTHRLARRVRDFTKVPGALAVEIAAAKFMKLVAWMREAAKSGDLGPVDRATIAIVVGLASPKDSHELAARRGETFYRWLTEAEFITADEIGHVRGWKEGPGRLVEARERDRLRQEHKRVGHPSPVAQCPTCESSVTGRQGSTAPVSATPQRLHREDVRRTGTPSSGTSVGQSPLLSTNRPFSKCMSVGRPTDDRDVRGTGTTGTTQQGTPSPRSVDRRETTGPGAEDPMEAKARAVLEAAEPFWRDVLMRLQLLGATSTVIAQFFERTRLEGSATVVCPNGFVRDWLRERWAVPLSEVLGELATFVTEAEWTAQQAEPAIPDVSA